MRNSTTITASLTKKAYDNINAYNQIFVDSVRATGSNNENAGCFSLVGTQISNIQQEMITTSRYRPTTAARLTASVS